MNVIFKNAMIITVDANKTIIGNGSIAVRGDRISSIGENEAVRAENPDISEVRDCSGMAVFPGFVNIHTHATLSIIRGVAEDMGTAPAYTKSVPQGDLLSEYESGVMAALGAAEALRFGSTLIADNYTNSANNAKVFSSLGIRAVVSERIHDIEFCGLPRGIYNRNEAMGERLLQNNIDLIETWNGKENGRIRCCLGPHAPDTCSPAYLERIASLAKEMGVGMATHLSQSRSERANVESLYGTSSARYLFDHGILCESLVAAHGVFLSDEDIALVAKSRASIAHAAEGNAKGGLCAPIMKMRAAGVNVGIATDNGSADMIEVMRIALCSARMLDSSCTAPQPYELLEMATINGARALGLDKEIGSLELGKKADLIIVDYNKPHMRPCINAIGNLVHTGLGSDVDTVMVDGNILVDRGRMLSIDLPALLSEAQDIAKRRWYEVNDKLDDRLSM